MRKKIVIDKSYRENVILGLILGSFNERSLLHDRHSLSFNLKRDINKLKVGDALVYWTDVTDSHLRILDEWDIKYLKLDNKLYGEYLRGNELKPEEREEIRIKQTKWWSMINLGHATFADVYREFINQKNIYSKTIFNIVKSIDLSKKDAFGNPIHKLDWRTESAILKTNELFLENEKILMKLKIGSRSYEEAFVFERYENKIDLKYQNDLNITLAKTRSFKNYVEVHNYLQKNVKIKKFKKIEEARLYIYKELVKNRYYPNFNHEYIQCMRNCVGYYF